jgi:hypothetical protein
MHHKHKVSDTTTIYAEYESVVEEDTSVRNKESCFTYDIPGIRTK